MKGWGPFLVVAASVLSGCSGDSSIYAFNTSGAYTQLTQPETVPVTRALASLPVSAGNIVSVIERREGAAIDQRIVLGGVASLVGENAITVRVARAEVLPSPDQSRIARELGESLPGVSLRIIDTLVQNSRGPVGLAYGQTAGNVGCLYAWQTTTQEDVNQNRSMFLFSNSMTTWDIRLRYCRAGLSRESAIALAGALSVGAYSDPMLASPASVAAMPAPVITHAEPVRAAPAPEPAPETRRPVGEVSRIEMPGVREAPVAAVDAVPVPPPSGPVPLVPGAPMRSASAVPTSVPVTVPLSMPAYAPSTRQGTPTPARAPQDVAVPVPVAVPGTTASVRRVGPVTSASYASVPLPR